MLGEAMMLKAQLTTPVLASILIATLMLMLVSAYALSQRLTTTSLPTPVPLTLRHIKADIDSDFSSLFCSAGLCINSTHENDAFLSLQLNYHPGLFGNLSNFTQSYTAFFNSSRSEFLTSGLASHLGSSYLLLREKATGSNYSFSQTSHLAFNYNSSSSNAYYLYYDCTNTSAVEWTPDIDDAQEINLTFSLINYTQKPINNTLFYSSPKADGHITFNGARYFVAPVGTTSNLGFDKKTSPADLEHRTYFSFNTSSLPDDATILNATLYSYVDSYVVSPGTKPDWRVDYYMGSDVIGPSLTSAAWGNHNFYYLDAFDYAKTTGWKNLTIPQTSLKYVTKTGQTDFELLARWEGQVQHNKRAYVILRQTEYTGVQYDPYLMVRYSFDGQCTLNRSLNYTTEFNTSCGGVNVSFIQGNLYTNFSHMNFSFNTTAPTNDSLGIYPMLNYTSFSSPLTSFSALCPSGNEPTYPAGIANNTYGSFNLSGSPINFIIANASGDYNHTYFDANGNCNFTDFTDEYFATPGEWMRLGSSVARLESISQGGSGITLDFASAGVEETLLTARLVQPIYLNK